MLAIVTNAHPPVPPVAATFRARATNAAAPEATLLAEVDRALLESYDAPSILVGVRVVLNGLDVAADEIAGPVTLRSAIDEPVGTAELVLWGWGRWHPLASRATWTRVPIEIWHRQGPPGRTRERLVFSGQVRPGGAQLGTDGLVRVQASDAAGAWAELAVCDELPPYAGFRRGEIVRRWADAAGIAEVDVPPGARLDLPVSIDGTRLMELLREFGEPEGWVFHATPAGALRGWVPRIKEAPEAPDHIWRRDDLASVTVAAPSGAYARVVLRGRGAAPVPAGLDTERSSIDVRGVYAVAVCTQRQSGDGSVIGTGLAPNPEIEQVVARIETEVTREGGRVVGKTVWVSTWHNLPAADRTAGFYGTPIEPRLVYISPEGDFVAWPSERFGRTSGRRIAYTYDDDGGLIETREERWDIAGQPAATHLLGPDGEISEYFGFRFLFLDGQSYNKSRWELRKTSEVITSGQFDVITGARTAERVQTWRYQTTPVAAEASRFRYVYGDGSLALEAVAPWRLAEDTTDQHRLDASGRLLQTTAALRSISVRRNLSGGYTVDGVQTDQETASLRRSDSGSTIYEERGEDGLAVIKIAKGRTEVDLQSGRAPLPTYRLSAWTELVLGALEVDYTDATLLDWFGAGKSVGEHPWAQDLLEIDRILRDRRARGLAFVVTVDRPETLATMGQTVEVRDYEQRLHHRLLVAQVAATRDPISGAATATYVLESPL